MTETIADDGYHTAEENELNPCWSHWVEPEENDFSMSLKTTALDTIVLENAREYEALARDLRDAIVEVHRLDEARGGIVMNPGFPEITQEDIESLKRNLGRDWLRRNSLLEWGENFGGGRGVDGALQRMLSATVNDEELASLFVRVGVTTRAMKGTGMLVSAVESGGDESESIKDAGRDFQPPFLFRIHNGTTPVMLFRVCAKP